MPERRPAFQCYASDDVLANGAVAELSHEAFGLFFRLYCRAWLEEGLPDDPERLARWARLSRAQWDSLWAEMAHLWTLVEGRWINDEQESKRTRVNAYVASRADNGRKGGRPRKEAHENHMLSDEKHMKSKAKAKKSSPSPSPSPTPLPTGEEEEPPVGERAASADTQRFLSWYTDHRRTRGFPDLTRKEMGKESGIAKRICEGQTAERVKVAVRGIEMIYPFAPPPIGRGEMWTMADLEKNFTRSCNAYVHPPQANGNGRSSPSTGITSVPDDAVAAAILNRMNT